MTVKVDDRFHFCAFCKHWYDPTNAHISPANPKINLWKFDEKARCKCLLSNLETSGAHKCGKYECKL